ncbi:MAG: universal stress protein [Desulfobacterota bacterium]|nr:universal stress protein [Thermodesulfobacteriota bacterium]
MHKKILHGLDGSAGSFKAFEEAVRLAKLFGAELHCISVEEVPRYAETIGEAEEEKAVANGKYHAAVARAKDIARQEGVTLHAHVVVGHEVKTILEFIKKNGFDLLIIGFMGHSAIYDRVMGSTCQSLVRLAPCTVLVVK